MHSSKLEEEIQALRERLATHELMRATKDLFRTRRFLGRCSFLVWDLMAFVGSMRERFTGDFRSEEIEDLSGAGVESLTQSTRPCAFGSTSSTAWLRSSRCLTSSRRVPERGPIGSPG